MPLLLLMLAQCSENGDGAPIETLLQTKKALLCQMETLQASGDSLWTAVAEALDGQLPKDMKPDERKNMINIKNTGLIQMFEVYPTLDPQVQRLVVTAGESDEQIALRMKATMEEMAENDQALNLALEKLEQKNKEKFSELKQISMSLSKKPCE